MLYTHPEIGKKITAIGGHYIIAAEKRLLYKDRELLYFIGCAAYDTTCCGTGGCGYALVPGFLLNNAFKKDAGGSTLSEIEPIRDKGLQKEIAKRIKDREPVQQVIFQESYPN